MRRVARLTVVVLALLAVAPALARGAEPGVVLGERAFGALPCGTPSVAVATFAGVDLLGGADQDRCEVLLNEDFVPHLTPAMRCSIVLHEYGHLAGLEHSVRRGSVMFAEFHANDLRCVAATRPALSRAARAPGTWGSGRRRG